MHGVRHTTGMHTLQSFYDNYRDRDSQYGPSPKRSGKSRPKTPPSTMGTVKQVDLGGEKLNPYQKPKPPSKTSSEIIKKMMPGK